MHPFSSVRLIQVSNNKNDHKTKFNLSASAKYRCPLNTGIFFTVNVGKEKNGTCRLIGGVRLLWGLLNRV